MMDDNLLRFLICTIVDNSYTDGFFDGKYDNAPTKELIEDVNRHTAIKDKELQIQILQKQIDELKKQLKYI